MAETATPPALVPVTHDWCRTHGHCPQSGASPTYSSWYSMKARCNNPNATGYGRYGARGIKVCPQWVNSFETFLADMGERPEATTIERKDKDGDYTPENCKWATVKQQQNNTSANVELTHNGKTMNLSQWAEFIGVNRQTIFARLYRGWKIDRVLAPKIFRKFGHI